MLPTVVSTLLESLPNADEVQQLIPKINEVKTLLTAANKAGKPVAADQQEAIVRRLDRAMNMWRLKKKFISEYNKLCGLLEVARGLEIALENLIRELENRRCTDAQRLIQAITGNLLGANSLLELPQRQLELTFQVLEPMLIRLTADKVTPPVQRSISEDVLATMSDEALESLPPEDGVVSATRRLINAIVRSAKSFQVGTVNIDRDEVKQQSAQLQSLVDAFKQLEELTYDVCELINDSRAVDTEKLQPGNRQFFDYLFPTEIITKEPSPEMQDAWRAAALQRQIKSDMEDTLSDCVRSNPVANALMAEFSQTKELKTYEEARWMVLPEARKKLETRLATEIYNKANDEVQGKEVIHRYPVEISQEMKAKFADGDVLAAMQIAHARAIELMQQILPEIYVNRNQIES